MIKISQILICKFLLLLVFVIMFASIPFELFFFSSLCSYFILNGWVERYRFPDVKFMHMCGIALTSHISQTVRKSIVRCVYNCSIVLFILRLFLIHILFYLLLALLLLYCRFHINSMNFFPRSFVAYTHTHTLRSISLSLPASSFYLDSRTHLWSCMLFLFGSVSIRFDNVFYIIPISPNNLASCVAFCAKDEWMVQYRC